MPRVSKKDVSLYSKRLIVAGSREFNQYFLFCKILDRYIKRLGPKDLVIISGAARKGPDAMSIRYAQENNLPWVEYAADWDQFQKSAGYIRNAEMNEVSSHLIAFWDCQSRGTENMISISEKAGKPTAIVLVYSDEYYEVS